MNLISETEARDRLHLPQHTLQRLRRLGQGPAWVRLGRKVYYREEALNDWVLASTRTPQNPSTALPNEGDNHV